MSLGDGLTCRGWSEAEENKAHAAGWNWAAASKLIENVMAQTVHHRTPQHRSCSAGSAFPADPRAPLDADVCGPCTQATRHWAGNPPLLSSTFGY